MEATTGSVSVGALGQTASLEAKVRRRALIGSAVGSAIEWYDYFLYGTMASLVFGPLFFPSRDPVSSQMLSLASFALAFLVRPIGGIVFSHIGDRIGRKRTLAITLVLMGGTTMLIGLMPTYAQVGSLAPILLTALRLVQGFAIGGNWGGGLLLAVEYAPASKRGWYGAVPQTGALIGLALGNFAASFVDSILSDTQFRTFGWRIPFLLSIVLVFVGFWIRRAIEETPSFQAVQAKKTTARVPLFTTFKFHWRAVLITIGAKFIETSTFFLFATFTISYAVSLGFERHQALNAVLYGALAAVPVMLWVGSISDRVGRKPTFVFGNILIMLYVIPFLWMLNQRNTLLLDVAVIVGFGVIWPMYGAVLGTFFAESYTSDVRYTGVSLGYQVGAAIAGGPLPLMATALLVAYHNSYIPVALLIVAFGAISLIAIACATDRSGRSLEES
jgi:MFS family permease